jgi:hypothetical protein
MFDPATQTAVLPSPQGVDAILAEMAQAGQVTRTNLAYGPPPTGRTPPKMRYSHAAMVDMIVENPAISQREIAAVFGRTESWVSTIVRCDAFQCMLAARKAELIDPELTLSHRERFNALTSRSLQVLQEKLAKPVDQISDNLVLRAVELGAKSLGIGGHAPPPPPPNPAEYLPAVAERLMRLQGRGPALPVSDANVIEG